ncbi:non-homologous end-joining DNA ligase [Streptacidiphilus sp. EB129]|uniref:non-homologous end-joining DNA ligase n=1 Tax=Streptacidiphilus sp. EB129 TaxID=3156262 RepID=UPI003519380E
MPRRTAPVVPVDLPVLEPMLASLGTLPLPGDLDDRACEVKWDGQRVLAYLDGAGGLRLRSRTGNDITARYPELGVLVDLLPGQDLILDGEIVALDEQGRPSFGRLQERMTLRGTGEIRATMQGVPATLMLFDLLWLRGVQITGLPYAERCALLGELGIRDHHVHVPPGWPGGAAAEALAWTSAMGMEGVVLKRLDAPYRPGARSGDWVKIKHIRSLDVVIGGWVPGGPRGTMVKSLLLGVPDSVGLRYVGAVAGGLSQSERRALAALLNRLTSRTSPFSGTPTGLERGEPLRFVRPDLRGEVEFLEITTAGHLRNPVWKGLRGEQADEPTF